MENYIAGLTLHERAVSGFPLSIGTSLALESLFTATQAPYDPNREIPNQINAATYESCYINLETLFRNLSSAVTKEAFQDATPKRLAATLEEEIGVIYDLFQTNTNEKCQPIFYHNYRKKLLNEKLVFHRTPSTEAQKYYQSRLTETLKAIERHTDSIRSFDDSVTGKRFETSLILTHHAYDLVNYQSFTRLDLLESNTGVLKPRARWSTKYYPMPGKSFDHLPFHRLLLLVFGDKVDVKPFPMETRNMVYEVSLKYHWNAMTTLEKVRLDLQLAIKDPYTLKVLSELS